jgi:hypothetical protein
MRTCEWFDCNNALRPNQTRHCSPKCRAWQFRHDKFRQKLISMGEPLTRKCGICGATFVRENMRQRSCKPHRNGTSERCRAMQDAAFTAALAEAEARMEYTFRCAAPGCGKKHTVSAGRGKRRMYCNHQCAQRAGQYRRALMRGGF